MNKDIEQLKIQIDELNKKFDSLGASTTIPYNVGEAFKIRVLGDTSLSAVSATAHNKTVNEAGTATYDVMNKPTGFVQITIQGTDYIIPYF